MWRSRRLRGGDDEEFLERAGNVPRGARALRPTAHIARTVFEDLAGRIDHDAHRTLQHQKGFIAEFGRDHIDMVVAGEFEQDGFRHATGFAARRFMYGGAGMMSSMCANSTAAGRTIAGCARSTWRKYPMIHLYGSVPGWTVPCLGPMTTKLAYYMTLSGLQFEMKHADLSQLDRDSPNGKVPWLEDDGTKLADSTQIIEYLRQKYGDALDAGATPVERAVMIAFNRLIDEHLYWITVVQPRYCADADWLAYLRMIVGSHDIPPEAQAFGDMWRARILKGYNNAGWTRLPSETLYARARADIDALSDFLADKRFFMGEVPRWIDASVLSILRHVIDAPFTFDTKSYGASKPNLLAYMQRMKETYGI